MQNLQSNATLQGGKYKIIKVLGQGGFGITYLAENTMLDGKMAIKEFFFKEYCDRDESTNHVTIPTSGNREIVERFRKKFIKEAKTIFKLSHPNIVGIYDVFEENCTAYYAMNYIEGESLGDMVKRRGAIPEKEAVGYIKEAGKALSYIHNEKMTHLDIKPGNIMRRAKDGCILLIDFGVAKQYDVITEQGTTTTPVGISAGYSPSEQYKMNGVGEFSPQSDVYALAATLFKLLTGTTPPEAMEVLDNGLPVNELKDKGVSPHIVKAIEAAMQSRSKRTQSIDAFMMALDKGTSLETSAKETEATLFTPEMLRAEEEHRRKKTGTQNKVTKAAESKNIDAEEDSEHGIKVSSKLKGNSTKLWIGIIVFAAIIIGGFISFNSGGNRHSAEVETTPQDSVADDNGMTQTTVDSPKYVQTAIGICTYSGEGLQADNDTTFIPNGHGVATFADGRRYDGEFKYGVLEGEATYTLDNGDTFIGTWKDNKYHKGRYTLNEDGSYFEGSFKNGEPDNGQWYDKNGNNIE